MAGFLDWLFGGGAQAQTIPPVPQGAVPQPIPDAVSRTGNPFGMGRDVQIQSVLAGLGQFGRNLAEQNRRRPVGAPTGPMGDVSSAMSRSMMSAYQQRQLGRHEEQQSAYEALIARMPEDQQRVFRSLGQEAGASALATAALRRGNLASPEEHARLNLPYGTLYLDTNGRPHVVQTPAVAGETERARFSAVPHMTPPGGEWTQFGGPAGATGELPRIRGAESGGQPGAINPQTGATGEYQFIPSTWSWLRQANPNFGMRYSDADINNPRAQAEAAPLFERAILERNRDMIGRTVNGVQVTPQALVRGGWLGGPDGVRRYVESNGEYNPADANGTRISDYFTATAPNMRRQAPGNQVAQAGDGRTVYRSSVPAPGTPERAFDTRYGTSLGERAASIHANAETAQQRLDEITQLRTAMQALRDAGGGTGAGAPAAQAVTRVLQAIGIDPAALGLPASAAPGEVVTAIGNRLAMTMIGPGGLPANNFSEADRNFLVQSMPNLANRPEANEFLANVMERAARRSIEMENRWLEARDQGKDYATFLREWRQHVNQNPIISTADRQTAAQFLGGRTITAPATASPASSPAAQSSPAAGPSASATPVAPPTQAPSATRPPRQQIQPAQALPMTVDRRTMRNVPNEAELNDGQVYTGGPLGPGMYRWNRSNREFQRIDQ